MPRIPDSERVTVPASAVALVIAAPADGPVGFSIRNVGNASLFIGGSDVVAGASFEVPAGWTVSGAVTPPDPDTTATLYGLVASGLGTVDVVTGLIHPEPVSFRDARQSSLRWSMAAPPGGGFILTSEKGSPFGVATLDENGKLLEVQLPPITAIDGGLS